jgi:hypothetical protein
MSELKAIESATAVIENVHLVYIKSEADKVIAELEMKLAAAQSVLRLNKPEALYSNLETMSRLSHKINVVERREHHHKYKRCLTMAKLCHWKMGVFIYKEEKRNFYHRWHNRWLELAEKFKEGV